MYKSTDGRAAIGAVAFDFYRCKRCTRLVTQPELARTLQANTGSACPCGGTTYAPTNLRRLEYLLPRVWTFALARACELWRGEYRPTKDAA